MEAPKKANACNKSFSHNGYVTCRVFEEWLEVFLLYLRKDGVTEVPIEKSMFLTLSFIKIINGRSSTFRC